MTDMFDFNTAESQRDPTELIPQSTVAIVMMKLRPGGHGPGGWLKNNNDGDALMVDAEFTVVGGPYNKRKFWGLYTVEAAADAPEGKKTAANISRGVMRSILESARGITPADESAEAMAARKVKGWEDFDGMVFCGKIGRETGNLKPGEPPNGERYADKNKLTCAVTPDSRQYVSPSNPEAAAQAAQIAAAGSQNFNGAGGAAQNAQQAQQQAGAINKPSWAG